MKRTQSYSTFPVIFCTVHELERIFYNGNKSHILAPHELDNIPKGLIFRSSEGIHEGLGIDYIICNMQHKEFLQKPHLVAGKWFIVYKVLCSGFSDKIQLPV